MIDRSLVDSVQVQRGSNSCNASLARDSDVQTILLAMPVCSISEAWQLMEYMNDLFTCSCTRFAADFGRLGPRCVDDVPPVTLQHVVDVRSRIADTHALIGAMHTQK
jgi:hypothetical protein